MPKSSTLSLTLPSLAASRENLSKALSSPKSPRSPRSPPVPSPKHDEPVASFADAYDPHSPITSLPVAAPSPISPKHKKDVSKSMFSNYKASKSSTKIQSTDRRDAKHHANSIYPYRKSPGSTPELSLMHDNASLASGKCYAWEVWRV